MNDYSVRIRDGFKNIRPWVQNKSMTMKYWIHNIQLKHCITKKFSLKTQWHLYVIFLAIFIIGSIFFREEFLFQVGVTLFSIAIVYLVMKQSNIDLQETTENQINVFATNIQMVCTELRNVCDRVDSLSVIMKDIQETLEKSSSVSKEAIDKTEKEKMKRKRIIKPKLIVRLELKGFNFIVDLRHYHLIVENCGSDALRTIVKTEQLRSDCYDITTNKQIDIDMGPFNNYKNILSLGISIETRDVDRNPYCGQVQLPLLQVGRRFPVTLIDE